MGIKVMGIKFMGIKFMGNPLISEKDVPIIVHNAQEGQYLYIHLQ